jgi:hypothetical protein
VRTAAGAVTRIAFHQTLPNLGRQGGAREVSPRRQFTRRTHDGHDPPTAYLVSATPWQPHAYLSFVQTFYSNLPHTIVFTQDDCKSARSAACPWLPPAPPASRFLARLVGDAAGESATHAAVPTTAGAGIARPTRSACMCNYVHEQFFTPHQYGQYPLMMTVRHGIFVPQVR